MQCCSVLEVANFHGSFRALGKFFEITNSSVKSTTLKSRDKLHRKLLTARKISS